MKHLKSKRIKIALLILVALAIVLGGGRTAMAATLAQCGPFTDVDTTSIWCSYIIRIYNLGITQGYADGTYKPNNNVIRGEMAAFLDRLTRASTNDNEPYVYRVDNMNNGATFSGDGIQTYSYDQDGLQGYSYGADWADFGVYGTTNSTSTGESGVYGYNGGNGPGVIGVGIAETYGYGVYGYSADAHAVFGDSGSPDYGDYGGWFSGPQGVYAQSEASSADAITARCDTGGNCWGLDTSSASSWAIYANTDVGSGYSIVTYDGIYAGFYNAASGFGMVAQNGSDAPLEAGDVVAVVGMAAPVGEASTPTLLVARAEAATASGVVGVVKTAIKIEMVSKPEVIYREETVEDPEGKTDQVSTRWVPEEVERTVPIQSQVEGPVESGALMIIQVQGMAQVKVDALAGAINAGDVLTVGAGGNAAQAVTSSQTGTILGKALEPSNGEKSLIWVLIDLR